MHSITSACIFKYEKYRKKTVTNFGLDYILDQGLTKDTCVPKKVVFNFVYSAKAEVIR